MFLLLKEILRNYYVIEEKMKYYFFLLLDYVGRNILKFSFYFDNAFTLYKSYFFIASFTIENLILFSVARAYKALTTIDSASI